MNRSPGTAVSIRLRAAARALLAIIVTAGFGSAALAAGGGLEIVVPAYFYPSSNSTLWDDMTAAADDVPITAIMNPGSGPGSFKDNNYVEAVNAFRAAGGRVIGYVHSSYGGRPLAQVLADIDKYDAWYGIDGIFVDEMANTGPGQRLDYYKAIYDHVKGIDPEWEVMGNPGTHTIEQYATWPTADRFMVFENTGEFYESYNPSAWNAEYDRDKFVHLVHTEDSPAAMESFLDLALARNAGGIYITHDVMNNPWDTLPSYWQAEVLAVAAINASFAAADFNYDGSVDAEDLQRWSAAFGRVGGGAAHNNGDANGDGAVDGADFLVWQRELGALQPLDSTSATAVPEPTPAALALAALIAVPRIVRRAGLYPLAVKADNEAT
ncbi:MAG TPA: spherulation-specific family 4 protein [Lacipirellula sp.]